MIEIRHLRKEFPESTPLRDVNTDIRDGDVIAVIGPSGTGKSTLLRCINLLETPTSGSIRIEQSSCDLPGAYSEIARYCSKNQIPPKTALRIQQVFEELVQQILVSELRKQRVCFRAEYSEANESTELIMEYEGAAFDLENAENRLALRLIRNAVSELCGERSEDGELPNRIRMRVRS